MENGQVWRRRDTTYFRLPNEDDLEGLTAKVSSGVLGSHFVELSHNNRRFRAERVD